MKYIRLLSCLVVLLLLAMDVAPARAGSRTLTVVPVTGKGIGVQGSGWGVGRVVVSLQTRQWISSVSLRPNPAGTFVVAAVGANLCAGVLFRAYDGHGHAKAARPAGPALGCATPADYPRPRLEILSGRKVTAPTVRAIAGHPASVTLHRGDVLYLWEPGTTAPFMSPRLEGSPSPLATPALLVLIAQGQTRSKTCAAADCAAGFYWKWLAVGIGDTGIVLSAACRQSKPPCMVPDFLIPVHIVP